MDKEQIRQGLKEREAELENQINALTMAKPPADAPATISDDFQDFEEAAVDFLEMHQEQSIQLNNDALLTEVRDALARLEDGTYGICVVCGQPIPEQRLEAIPWTARCVKDQEELEERNLSREELYDQETF